MKVDLPPSVLDMNSHGGDVSGGGFGLEIRGTQDLLLHDLWCENRRIQFQAETKSPPGSLRLNPDPSVKSCPTGLKPFATTDISSLNGFKIKSPPFERYFSQSGSVLGRRGCMIEKESILHSDLQSLVQTADMIDEH